MFSYVAILINTMFYCILLLCSGHSAKSSRSYTLPSRGDSLNHYSTRESVAMESFASPDIYKIDDNKSVTLNNPVVDSISVQEFQLEFLENWERAATIRK